MGSCPDLMDHVDGHTVQELQSQVPKVSNTDLKFLENKMDEHILFPKIQNPEHWRLIWDRLQMIDVPIPTLGSFFKDLHYLDVGRKVMEHLLPRDPELKVPIDEGVGGQYHGTEGMTLHTRQRMIGRGLYELWRFSLQYGFEMIDNPQVQRRVPQNQSRPEHSTSPSLSSQPNSMDQELLWRHFLWLADHHGFTIPPALGIQLQRANLPEPVPCEHPEEHDENEPLIRRCGLPYTDSVDADRYALDRETLGRAYESRRVTVRLVRQAFFQAFFGYLREDTSGYPTVNVDTTPVETQGTQATSNPSPILTEVAGMEEITDPPSVRQMSPADLFPQLHSFTTPDWLNFRLLVTIPNQDQRGIIFPFQLDNMQIWEEFFYKLDEYGFHITSNGRGVRWNEWFQWYADNPGYYLNATYLMQPGEEYLEMGSSHKRRRVNIDLDGWLTGKFRSLRRHGLVELSAEEMQVWFDSEPSAGETMS